METKPVIHVVGTRCRPEDEEKLNKWYDEVHIPLLLRFKGIKEVTRYKITGEAEGYPEHLTIYKFDSREAYQAYETSPELAVAREEMRETWKEGSFEIKWRVQYESLKTWER